MSFEAGTTFTSTEAFGSFTPGMSACAMTWNDVLCAVFGRSYGTVSRNVNCWCEPAGIWPAAATTCLVSSRRSIFGSVSPGFVSTCT